MRPRILTATLVLALLPSVVHVYSQEGLEIMPYFETSISSTGATIEEIYVANGSVGQGQPLTIGIRIVPTRGNDHTQVSRVFLRCDVKEVSQPGFPTVVLRLRFEEAVEDMEIVVHAWRFQTGTGRANFASFDSQVLGKVKVDGKEASVQLAAAVGSQSFDVVVRSGEDYHQQLDKENLAVVESAVLRVAYIGIPSIGSNSDFLFAAFFVVVFFVVFYLLKHGIRESDRTTGWDRMGKGSAKF